MDRVEKSVEAKHSGNNCCQAVLLAYANKLGLDEESLKAAGASLGLGMGNMEGVCGALIGAQIAQGLLQYKGTPLAPQSKSLQEAFVKKTGGLICKDIKGVETGKMLCSCDDCCRNAVRCLEELGL